MICLISKVDKNVDIYSLIYIYIYIWNSFKSQA